jgi:hypothetical protein
MLVELEDLEDPAQVKGHHLCLAYGRHARELRTFCQLLAIEVLV